MYNRPFYEQRHELSAIIFYHKLKIRTSSIVSRYLSNLKQILETNLDEKQSQKLYQETLETALFGSGKNFRP